MSIFSKVSKPKIKTSKFNLSEEAKLSMNIGDLVPILCKETLPGDKFNISTEMLIKFAPLKTPMMHRINAYVHYFYVPIFQVNNQFERFINPKVNTDNSIIPANCSVNKVNSYGKVNSSLKGSLADYLGLPIMNSDYMASTSKISLYPFLCYQHIYNSYYRDQNLEPLTEEGGNLKISGAPFDIQKWIGLSGTISSLESSSVYWQNLFQLRKRAWKKDYFTSALPSPQAGNDVLIPITSGGPVSFTTDAMSSFANPTGLLVGRNGLSTDPLNLYVNPDGTNHSVNAYAEVSNQSASINDLRRAMALQRFKELAERGGTRYSEMVQNFYNAYLPDYWVDRPIFLGGQKTPISVGEVVQTSQTTLGSDGSYQGTRAGIASAYGRTGGVTVECPAHGYIFGILSLRPEATYSQGVERMWTRQSIFDYAFPQFANLGEQEILQKEIYATGDSAADNTVFGYTPRYAEYKEGHCHIAGEFRDTLKDWHMGREFASSPTLSKQFVQMDQVNYTPFAVTDNKTEHVYVDLYNNILARRPLPYFGTPSII